MGRVVGLGQRTVEVDAVDPATRRTARHSFVLTRETRADLVHVGDPVEVIYAPSAGEMELRRLLVFYAGLPMAGPPAAARADASLGSGTSAALARGSASVTAPPVASTAAPIVRSAPAVAPNPAKPAPAKMRQGGGQGEGEGSGGSGVCGLERGLGDSFQGGCRGIWGWERGGSGEPGEQRDGQGGEYGCGADGGCADGEAGEDRSGGAEFDGRGAERGVQPV